MDFHEPYYYQVHMIVEYPKHTGQNMTNLFEVMTWKECE